jgi:hypothetical protein
MHENVKGEFSFEHKLKELVSVALQFLPQATVPPPLPERPTTVKPTDQSPVVKLNITTPKNWNDYESDSDTESESKQVNKWFTPCATTKSATKEEDQYPKGTTEYGKKTVPTSPYFFAKVPPSVPHSGDTFYPRNPENGQNGDFGSWMVNIKNGYAEPINWNKFSFDDGLTYLCPGKGHRYLFRWDDEIKNWGIFTWPINNIPEQITHAEYCHQLREAQNKRRGINSNHT